MNKPEYLIKSDVENVLKEWASKAWQDDWKPIHDSVRGDTFMEAMLIVNDMPPVDVQPVDRWISVKERPPKIGEQVLVCDEFNQIDKMEYIGNGLWSRNDFTYKTNEKHFWQPLPKPPETTKG